MLNGVKCRRACSYCLLKAEVAAVLNAKVRSLGIPRARSLTALGHMALFGHERAGTLLGSAGGIYPCLTREFADGLIAVQRNVHSWECANVMPFGTWLALDKDWV